MRDTGEALKKGVIRGVEITGDALRG